MEEPREHEIPPDVAACHLFFDRDGEAIDLSTYLRLFADPAHRFLARDQVGSPAADIELVTAWPGVDQRTLPDERSRSLPKTTPSPWT